MISPRVIAVTATSLMLAGGSGFMVASAIGASPPAPQKTVTVNIPTGTTGPQGPPGPPGPSGTLECPTGFVPGEVILNHPGGQVTIYGCIQ